MEKNKRKIYIVISVTLVFLILIYAVSATVTTADVHAATTTPLAKNGSLSIKGSSVVNKDGKKFVIKGVSSHGLSWFPEYMNKGAMKSLRDEWGVNTVRLAMFTTDYKGYCNSNKTQKTKLKKIVEKAVDDATSLGMYVIIDWHILADGNPKTYQNTSKAFFKYMAKKYNKNKNVLFEICNEPNGRGGSWKNIRSYATDVIKTIRSVNKKAIIIVGTPTWSQDVDIVANNPLKEKNVAYAFHFYAATHKGTYRSKLTKAIKKGLPIIVTEFGLSEASGRGKASTVGGNNWFKLLDKYKIGRVCWSLSNKGETCSLIKSSCKRISKWRYSDLSTQGKWLVKKYGGKLAKKK